jgi:vibriolysin
MRNGILLRGFGVSLVVLVAAACQGTDEDRDSVGKTDIGEVQLALEALPSARVVDVDRVGVPSFITGELAQVSVDLVSDRDLAPALSAIAPAFRASAGELVLTRMQTDNIGDRHYRFSQVKNGLKVIGGELVLHARDGMIYAANGSARSDLEATATAEIEGRDAIAAALGSSRHLRDAAVSAEPELSYRLQSDRIALVYAVEVTGTQADGTPARDTVLVSARDGAIALRIQHIHTAKLREVHNTNHSSTLPGPVSRSEGGPVNADQSVNINYDWLGATYDCYANLFGRDSFDNNGAKLISTVHYSTNYVNAFWNGTQMVYGDGDGVLASNLAHSMDVTAHELTHAVTERTSGLIYADESGGLNEAMSDIFGGVCEWYRDGQVVTANTWIVGDDCWTPATPGDGLRYMANPTQDGSSIDYYPDYFTNLDVHYSSGIANLAFYLLSQGGSHPGGKTTTVVTGIGIAKAAQVFYRANASILTASSNFAAAKTATEQAAQQLGYTAAEVASVTAAWEAVGVGIPIPPPVPTVLTSNVPVTDIKGNAGSDKFFTLEVPAGATSVTFTISGGGGDSDLYVKFGEAPTLSSYDCRPYLGGNSETCSITNVQPGTYYAMLHGYTIYSGVTLTGSYSTGGGGGGTCAHNKCTIGGKLSSSCDPCVAQICAVQSSCCTKKWTSTCVAKVASVCGLTCN